MNTKPYVRGLAVLLVVLMSIQGYTGTATAQTLNQPPTHTLRYDGETIFRGVFLADGPVANLFPEIWHNSKIAPTLEERAQHFSPEQIAEGNQHLIDGLKAQDPTFFARFGNEMQSGDRIRIDNAIEEASQRLGKLAEKSANPAEIVEVYAAIYAVVAVVVAAVAVLVVFAGREPGQHSSLQREMLVNLLAQRLAPVAH